MDPIERATDRVDDLLFGVARDPDLEQLIGEHEQDRLGVTARLDPLAALREVPAELDEVGHLAVVRKQNTRAPRRERLGIDPCVGAADGRVPYVPDPGVAAHRREHRLGEDLIDPPHVFVEVVPAVSEHSDAGGVLPSMLDRLQTDAERRGRVGDPDHTDEAAHERPLREEGPITCALAVYPTEVDDESRSSNRARMCA